MKAWTDERSGERVLSLTSPTRPGSAWRARAEIAVRQDGTGSILVRDIDAARIVLSVEQMAALKELLA